MAIKLDVVRGNEIFSLNGGSLVYRVETTGIGLPTIRRLRQAGPFQLGVTNRGFRLDERAILLTLFFQAASLGDADARRDILAEIFKPLESTPLSLRFTRDDGSVRQIDGYADGVIDFPDTPDRDRIGVSQRVVVPFVPTDNDPVFYDPALQRVKFTNLSGSGFIIPFEVPLIQNTGTLINATQSVVYDGNWQEYPIIYVTGPATDITITNLTTDETLDFPALVLTAGQTMTIDLRFGSKTIRRENGANLLPYLSEDSDLAYWHLATTPEASGGVNNVQVAVADDVTSTTALELTYYNRYTHV
jgi:hypothetical protein